MKKSYTIDYKFNDMRLDRWIRNNLGNVPQSLIEKNLRSGKWDLDGRREIYRKAELKPDDYLFLIPNKFKISSKTQYSRTRIAISILVYSILIIFSYILVLSILNINIFNFDY